MEKTQDFEENEQAAEQPQSPANDKILETDTNKIPTDTLLSLKSEEAKFKVTSTSHALVSTSGEYHPHYEYYFTVEVEGGSALLCKHRFNDFKRLQKQIGFKSLPGPQKWWYTGGQDEAYAAQREQWLKQWLEELLNDSTYRRRINVVEFLK